MFDARKYLRRLRESLARLLESPTDELGRWGRFAVYQIRLWRFCGRQLVRDRLVSVAGDLTFKTLLGLIPLLVLFALIINFFARATDLGSDAQDMIFRYLKINEIHLQVDGKDVGIADQIDGMVASARTRLNEAAAIGIAFLFLLSMNVLATIETAVNRIWHVERKRPLWKKLIMFWLVLTLGPPAAALAAWGSAELAQRAAVLAPWVIVLGRSAMGLGAVWFVFFILYRLMPRLPVRWGPALAGAAVAGTLWHVVAKQAFACYIQYAVGYGRLYGSLGVVPLFFLWVYVTWIFILFGCEVAYVIQNFKDLARADALERERERSRFLAADFVGLVAMAACARRFCDGSGPTTVDLLVGATGVGRDHLEVLLGRLEAGGLVARTPVEAAGGEEDVAWLPAREPGRISLADVLRAARSDLPVPADPAQARLNRRVREAYDEVRGRQDAEAARVTVADLISQPPPTAPDR